MKRHATVGYMGATRQKDKAGLTRKVRGTLDARDRRGIQESAHLLDSKSLD
jgi:hypothetical protein